MFDFENATARLFEESSECQDGGFILVTAQANSLRLKTVFKSTGSDYVVEPYELSFDASYHGLQQSECDFWYVKQTPGLLMQTDQIKQHKAGGRSGILNPRRARALSLNNFYISGCYPLPFCSNWNFFTVQGSNLLHWQH